VSRNWSTAELAQVYKDRGSISPVADACAERPAKYRAKRTRVDGITFDSSAEAKDYMALKVAQQVGAISDLELQPSFLLQEGFTDSTGKRHRPITYRADFRFKRDGKLVIADRKGPLTPPFRMKEKMFRAKYPELTLEIWK
jgi:hypothetical protein